MRDQRDDEADRALLAIEILTGAAKHHLRAVAKFWRLMGPDRPGAAPPETTGRGRTAATTTAGQAIRPPG
jgi:hypothetical protein